MATRAEITTAEAFMPARISLPTLRDAAKGCKGCDLYKCATQTVFGEGPKDARVVFVGEQPGDQEDRQGKPFIGPSGRMFDSILAMVGIDRNQPRGANAPRRGEIVAADSSMG